MTDWRAGGQFLAGLREARWLTRSRVHAVAVILLAQLLVAVAVWIWLADGMLDIRGKPIGTDFAAFHAAGSLALDGRPEDAFRPAVHYAVQQRMFARADLPFYAWHYPPTFLLVAAALAALPYGAALATWMALTLALYLRTLAPLLAGYASTGWLLALAFPGVFFTLAHGQTGFLAVALLGGGLSLLPTRPALAGVLFGLLSFKPQYGLLIPLVLIATGNWRAFAAATGATLALAAASYAVFGRDCWTLFLTEVAPINLVVLEAGMAGWHKLQSVFAALRHWGAPLWLAFGGHAFFALAVAVVVMRLWRGKAGHDLKAAALVTGAVLVSPYFLDYDLVLLALPIALLARRGIDTGFQPWEKAILALAFLMPLLARTVASVTTLPLGVLASGLLLWAIARRAAGDDGIAHDARRLAARRHRTGSARDGPIGVERAGRGGRNGPISCCISVSATSGA